MLPPRSLAFAFVLSALMPTAHADWAALGAAYKCNPSEKTFSLRGTIESSSGDISPEKGFIVLKDGDTTIRCSIGRTKIMAKIVVASAQPSGECMGRGAVRLVSFQVNDADLIDGPKVFTNDCHDEKALIQIDVTENAGAPKSTLCRGKWDWSDTFTDVECIEHVSK